MLPGGCLSHASLARHALPGVLAPLSRTLTVRHGFLRERPRVGIRQVSNGNGSDPADKFPKRGVSATDVSGWTPLNRADCHDSAGEASSTVEPATGASTGEGLLSDPLAGSRLQIPQRRPFPPRTRYAADKICPALIRHSHVPGASGQKILQNYSFAWWSVPAPHQSCKNAAFWRSIPGFGPLWAKLM